MMSALDLEHLARLPASADEDFLSKAESLQLGERIVGGGATCPSAWFETCAHNGVADRVFQLNTVTKLSFYLPKLILQKLGVGPNSENGDNGEYNETGCFSDYASELCDCVARNAYFNDDVLRGRRSSLFKTRECATISTFTSTTTQSCKPATRVHALFTVMCRKPYAVCPSENSLSRSRPLVSWCLHQK